MKAEFALEEIKNLIKKNQKNNKLKTLALCIVGMAVIFAIVVVIISKLKHKDALEYDDWSELDDMDYDDFEDFDDFDEYEEEAKDEEKPEE